MKRVLIGQAPSAATDGQPPFSGRVGLRLAGFAGLSAEEFRERFELRNVFQQWPGKAGRGDAFPMGPARAIARRFTLEDGARVVFVGAKVAEAFELFRLYPDAPPCRWIALRHAVVGWIPHPSGLTLWYNDRSNRSAVEKFLQEMLGP